MNSALTDKTKTSPLGLTNTRFPNSSPSTSLSLEYVLDLEYGALTSFLDTIHNL